jgi:hypothetical protein
MQCAEEECTATCRGASSVSTVLQYTYTRCRVVKCLFPTLDIPWAESMQIWQATHTSRPLFYLQKEMRIQNGVRVTKRSAKFGNINGLTLLVWKICVYFNALTTHSHNFPIKHLGIFFITVSKCVYCAAQTASLYPVFSKLRSLRG